MNLFDYGLDLQDEPNPWDIFEIISLRVYDMPATYFACWDFGPAFGMWHSRWPIMRNLEKSWNFNPSFHESFLPSILRDKNE